MPASKDTRTRFNREVDHGLDWMQREKNKGFPEFRRDALYAPFLIPGGAWDTDEQLDHKLRRAKVRGGQRVRSLLLVYVYARPPVWTCDPSAWVLELGLSYEFMREHSALQRWTYVAPTGSRAEACAQGGAMSAMAMMKALGVELSDPPPNDPTLARIDARPGLANVP